jgi:serine/threonine protein phosphatase PrpC
LAWGERKKKKDGRFKPHLAESVAFAVIGTTQMLATAARRFALFTAAATCKCRTSYPGRSCTTDKSTDVDVWKKNLKTIATKLVGPLTVVFALSYCQPYFLAWFQGDTGATAATAKPKNQTNRPIRFEVAGAQMQPSHKDVWGGEDSFFISEDRDSFGVLDGEAGWKDTKHRPEAYANVLGTFCRNRANENFVSHAALELLEYAYNMITNEGVVEGASTASIVTVHDLPTLKYANIGDSGIFVLRPNHGNAYDVVFSTDARYSAPGVPLQLSSEDLINPRDAAAAGEFTMQEDDLIVVGSSGLLNNLTQQEMTSLLTYELLEKKDGLTHVARSVARKTFTAMMNGASEGTSRVPIVVDGTKLDDLTILLARRIKTDL